MNQKVLACVIAMAFLVTSEVSAEGPMDASLRGFDGVSVKIESKLFGFSSSTITPETIREAIVQQLRSEGIRVLTDKEMLERKGNPQLRYVILLELIEGTQRPLGYAYGATVEFTQAAKLTSGQVLRATTWTDYHQGTHGLNGREEFMQLSVPKLSHNFATAFKKVNAAR